VWDRLLCAIDQFESGQTTLAFVAGVASANEASVRVLHIREVPRMARVLPLESAAEAQELVRDAVLSLRRLGIAAEGRSCSVQQDHVARRIVDEALLWECQVVVLGSRRLHGIGRLSGRGVREEVLRLSSLPVLVGPAAESNGSTGLQGSDLTGSSPHPPLAGRRDMVQTIARFLEPERWRQ
jgi:nucleotide-binding universal stress UspA family protein